jgi:Family of unknown function (DUF6459)
MTSTLPATRIVVRRLPDLDGELPEPPVRPPASPDATTLPSRGPTTSPGRVRVHAHLVVRQILEVLDGRRPAAQLADLVAEPVLRYLTAAARRLDRPGLDASRRGRRLGAGLVPATERVRGAGLRSMRICQPTERAAEVSVVWRHRGRFRALAARFELPGEPSTSASRAEAASPDPRWRCTALRIG